MSRRAVVLALATTIAVAIAIPALASSGPTAQSGSLKGLSVRALGKAKAALRTARAAKRSVHKAAVAADEAAGSAAAAQAAAAAAKTEATAAKGEATQAFEKAASAREVAAGAELKAKETAATVAGTHPEIGSAEAAVSTSSGSFVPLAGGPSVTVSVPQTGLIQVWAQALIQGDGAVSLYEGGHQVEGQALECNGAQGVLFAVETPLVDPVLAGTPAVGAGGTCSALGAPGPVLLRTVAGEHTYTLRYASTGAEEPIFSERHLVVQALP